MAYVKAEFVTAKDQHEIPMDLKVYANTAVGRVVYNDSGTLKERATVASVVVGDYIVAQSDMTLKAMDYVPSQLHNYTYDPSVKASTVDKHVALYKITDMLDVVLTLVS